MNKNRIESTAVSKIEEMCFETERLEPFIPTGDKTPSYDGSIAVYNSTENTIKNCIGTIPVQVKGSTLNRFSKNGYKYDVKVDDLRLYSRDRGCFFFIVFIKVLSDKKIKHTKVFARQLHRVYISSILNKISNDQKTITIEFYELAQKNLYIDCEKFLDETNKQVGNTKELIKLKSKNLVDISTPETLVVDSRGMIVNDFYLYSNIDGIGVVAVDTLSLEAMERGQYTTIDIDGQCINYFYKYRIDSKYRTLTINNVVKIKIDDRNSKGNYELMPIRNLADYKKGLFILKYMAKGGDFKIGSVDINIKKFGNIEHINKIYELMCEIIEVSKEYGELFRRDFESTDLEKQLNEITGLVKLLKYKENNFYKINHEGLYKVRIDKHHVLIGTYKKNEYFNYFSKELIDSFYLESEKEKYYPFIGISFEALSNSYNVNLNFISNLMSLEKLENISEDRWNMLNSFCLRLIKAFDHVQDIEYLRIAQDILERLNGTSKHYEFIKSINLMQINYRIKGHLERKEIDKLINYKKSSHIIEYEMKLLHVNTLLKNKQEAINNFENLSEDEKLDFSLFPMYYLFEKTIQI